MAEEKVLRNGYTTGSCAAAAAKAAAYELLAGISQPSVIITLPDGERAEFDTERVSTPLCCFRVRKDSGDDPDVTDKVFVYAACRAVTAEDIKELALMGKGYLMQGEPPIYIDGGPGIGVATLEGLACPVGHYAINPVPREETARAVRDVCEETERYEPVHIILSIPEGEVIQSKTFNPKLGIKGGISILGTSGIVHPMSDDAILSTIRLEFHMRAVEGDENVLLTPGNYGELFLKERFGIPEGTAVQISNFVRDSVVMACEEGFAGVLLAGHIGKLIKAAAGFPDTHSRYGDKRMETFASLLDKLIIGYGQAGDGIKFYNISYSDLKNDIMAANTTDEAISYLASACGADAERVITAFLNETAEAVKYQLDMWTEGKLNIGVIVFSRDGFTGATAGAQYLLNPA